jgi:prepilin-type N-terminal cleavage/methylation domain-containing protein
MDRHKRQSGFTLTEVLVATAIFTIIMLAALLMYDRNNRVFKSGVQASDVQQNTRIGFDKLVSDLRIEGFDYNRNGDPSGSVAATGINYQRQPDEQIEYMGDGAIVFRSNFNYNTGYDNGREGSGRNPADLTDTYEAPAFPLVTTANNEIVVYALQSNSGNPNANKSVISFYADVAKPRKVYSGTGGESKERQVSITGYDTTNNFPPYTLYRLTLKDADIVDNDPSPIGAAVPIATNVRSLKFLYYSDQAAATTALTPVYGAGQYDASNAQAVVNERSTRSSIQAVRVDLIGMESAPDANYSSPLETTATSTTGVPTDANGVPVSRYRQYELSSLIVPRNVGKRAIKEEDLKHPDPAKLTQICYGACAVPYFTWQAPTTGNVDFYAIIYDTDKNGTFSNGYPVGNVTSAYFPRPLNPGTTYYFRIESSNGYGDAQSAEIGSINAIATTTPGPPTGANATTNLTNRIRLTWQTPSQYASTPTPTLTCVDPGGSPAGTVDVSSNGIAGPENIGYRVYRSTDQNFDPTKGEGEKIASETNGNQPFVDISGVATLDDYVPDCITYYYRIQTVAPDCVNNANYNSPAQTSISMSDFYPKVTDVALPGKAISAAAPAAPTNLAIAIPAACQPGTLHGAGVSCNATITFDKVTQDTSTPAQPVKIDSYALTRTTTQPISGSSPPTSIGGDWDPFAAGYVGGNSITSLQALPMTDATGRSYQYTFSIKATNACSPDSAAVTNSTPSGYFAIPGEPVTATTSDGGDGTVAKPYELYPDSSTLVFSATGMASLQYFINDASGNPITSGNASTNPFALTIPDLNLGQEYSVDFIAKDASGNYFTETVFFVLQGGVCDYGTAPTPTPSPAQANSGLSAAKAWSLQPGQTVTWTATDLAKTEKLKIIDTSNSSVVTSFSLPGTTEKLPWPTLPVGTPYEIDVILQSTPGCQREQFYFVNQVCSGYGGSTPTFLVTDATHTGLSTSSAWQVTSGGTIKLTESSMKTLKVTVTDITANKSFATSTYTAVAGVATITWPPTGVSGVNNDVFQVDMVLVDANGCTSSTYTRYVTQYCSYSGSAPTIANTQTLRNSADTSGTGTTSTSPLLMVPLVDVITVTESQVKTVYVDYLDASTGTSLSGVSSQTWTGSSPIKFNNPIISGENGKTYRIDITLADSNGCKSSKYTYYVKQVPCVLKPQQSASDTSVISALFNPSGNGSNLANTITVYNRSNQQITLNSLTLEFSNLGSGNQVKDVRFSTGTVTVGIQTGPTSVTAPGGTTVAANSSVSFIVDYNYKPTVTPLTGVCVTYTTSTNTPTSTVTQSCNIQYSASNSVLNPSSCD